MPLFQKLLNLHTSVIPEEDFFTEIFVAILSRNKDLVTAFLARFLNVSEAYYDIRVQSQVSLAALAGHNMGSRPDVLIQLFTEDAYDLILIESKLGSSEGDRQLSRYADHLAETFSGARERYLLYITRSYDPKDAEQVIGKPNDHVHFKQIRWSQFYDLLKSFRSDSLVDEMAIFMEENQMAENTQLLPADLFAMTVVPRLMDFMVDSLEGEVKEKFVNVLGVQPYPIKLDFQLREQSRLIVYQYVNNHWWFGVGYFFDRAGKKYPDLGMNIEISAKSTRWNDIASGLQQIYTDLGSKDSRWKTYGLSQPQSWAGLAVRESIAGIADSPDHLHVIKQKLMSYLDDVATLKTKYPSLPWAAQ